MGNISSYQNDIYNSHNNLNDLFNNIQAESNRIINLILGRNYTDRDFICSKIGFEKVNELGNTYEVYHLNNIREKLGLITLDDTDIKNMEHHKKQICLDIVNFYVKKINLISNIQKELPFCKKIENETYEQLEGKLGDKDITQEEWLNIYNQMQNFQKNIHNNYNIINEYIEKIKSAENISELDGLTRKINNLLDRMNSMCQISEEKIDVNAHLHEKILYKSTNTSNMTLLAPDIQPQIHTVVQDVPVIQRTLVKPKIVRHEIVQNGLELEPIPDKSVIITRRKETPILREIRTVTTPISQPVPINREVTTRKFKVRGEKIERRNGSVIVKNPKEVKILTANNNPGRPVRAIKTHIPNSSSEVPLVAGQSTTYLGTSQNGWARIRHVDGKEGYVPHSYLSL